MYNLFEGRLFEAMYYISAKNRFLLEYVPSGLLGSLIDRENGILILAPIFIYIFIGFAPFFNKFKTMNFQKKTTRLFIAILIIVHAIFVTMYPHILGGQNPAGRYFIPIFPALVILFAFAMETLLRYRIHRIIIGVMLIWTLLITVILTFNPMLALPFGTDSYLVHYIFKDYASIIHKILPNFSKYERTVTAADYMKGTAIFSALLLLTFSHRLFREKSEAKIKKKISGKAL
jgi:hypothetical protein